MPGDLNLTLHRRFGHRVLHLHAHSDPQQPQNLHTRGDPQQPQNDRRPEPESDSATHHLIG